MNQILLIISMFFMSVVSFAQETVPPGTIEEAMAWLPQLIAKIVAGDYLVAGGILVMVLMVVVRKYLLPKVGMGKDWLPIVTALVGALSMAGLSMFNGVPMVQAAINGVVLGIFSSGAWDLIGKSIMKMILGDKYKGASE